MDYFIDNANYEITYWDTIPADYVNGAEHNGDFICSVVVLWSGITYKAE